jgi:hypothetical protein
MFLCEKIGYTRKGRKFWYKFQDVEVPHGMTLLKCK